MSFFRLRTEIRDVAAHNRDVAVVAFDLAIVFRLGHSISQSMPVLYLICEI